MSGWDHEHSNRIRSLLTSRWRTILVMQMKVLAFAIVLLTACETVKHFPGESTFVKVDFTKYTQLGFFITPEKYNGEYESIGMVEYTAVPESNLMESHRYADGSVHKIWGHRPIYVSQGVDSLYSFSKSMGADAIINFTVDAVIRDHPTAMPPVTVVGYKVSGFAIKRKD